MKFAAIDIGSNAVRLLITEVIEGSASVRYKKRLFVRLPIRLGEDVFTKQKISEEKISELIKGISAFKNTIDIFKVDSFMACATSALREAENGEKIIVRIKEETGIKIEIIDGKKEAAIIYACHVAEKLNHNKPYLYIDVGGGSTELTLFHKNEIVYSNSFQVGAVRMLLNKVTEVEWERMKAKVKELGERFENLIAIGTGGNINRIFKMVNSEDKTIKYKELKELYQQLSELTIEERIKKYSLNQDRADVIVPAAKIYSSAMKWSGANDMYVPKLGLVDGIVNMLYEKQTVH